jgi:PEP-CTERM motif
VAIPVSGALTINGITVALPVNYQGFADAANNYTIEYLYDPNITNPSMYAYMYNVAFPIGGLPDLDVGLPVTNSNGGSGHFQIDFGSGTASGDFSGETVAIGPAVSAVPEPATWAMLILGFAGLGIAGYRRSGGALRTMLAA